MDEPLANLDALLRMEMRVELKRLQDDLGQTLVYVTHDQVEAMSMSDRIAVMRLGRLQQCDEPDIIYGLPANRFVATVVGSPPTNFISGQVSHEDDLLVIAHPGFRLQAAGTAHPLKGALEIHGALPEQVLVGVRPEDVGVSARANDSYTIPAQVSVIEPLGAETVVDLQLGPDYIKAVVPPTQRLDEGQHVWLRFEPTRIHFFDVKSEDRVYSTKPAEELECPLPATD
jgi:multiple sugar transport system ATP-binding protein